MHDLILVLKKDEIKKKTEIIAHEISSYYQDRELIVIGVLKGSFIFLSDLVRKLTIPVKVDFIRVCSYGYSDSSSESINLTKGIEIDVKNKDVLVIEDIVDTGLTLSWIVDYLKAFNPKTLRVCTLIDKIERRKATIKIDYAGHVAEKGFLVGYGLDYAEDYRGLPDIYHLKL